MGFLLGGSAGLPQQTPPPPPPAYGQPWVGSAKNPAPKAPTTAGDAARAAAASAGVPSPLGARRDTLGGYGGGDSGDGGSEGIGGNADGASAAAAAAGVGQGTGESY